MRLIDADALMKEFQEPVLVRSDEWDGWHKCFALVIKTINRLPTIEERKKGKWIEDSGGTIACSVCHIIWLYRRTDYCPHCGADMRGGEE